MADKATLICELRRAVKFNGSSRITRCCKDRHGFMIKHFKCVGKGHNECPKTEGRMQDD